MSISVINSNDNGATSLTKINNNFAVVGGSSMSGSVFPSSPLAGNFFLHEITGREILYQYDGATWQTVYSYGAIILYVDKANGTDDLLHGTGTTVNAFASIGFALGMIPRTGDKSAVTVYVSGASYNENIELRGYNNGQISVIGTTNTVNSLSATGGYKGGGLNTPYVTGTFTPGIYDNKLIKFTSGANNGLVTFIGLTTSTGIYLLGSPLNADPVNGDSYQVLDWTTTATVLTGSIYCISNLSTGVAVSTVSSLNIFYVQIVSSPTWIDTPLYAVEASLCLQYCDIGNEQSRGCWADVNSLITLDHCYVHNAITGSLEAVHAEFKGQVDLLSCKVLGYSIAQGQGLDSEVGAVISCYNSEISNFLVGILADINSTVDFSGKVHGNGTGIQALKHSYVRTNVDYGHKLDGTTDINTANTNVETSSYSFIT